MGYNTTVLILNDGLHEIEQDQDFGARLADKIRLFRGNADRNPDTGIHTNAVSVIETHHSGDEALIAVGGNYGTRLGLVECKNKRHDLPDGQIELLRKVASLYGYRLVPDKRGN